MNQNASLEDRLNAAGATLRARPRLTNAVMIEVRRCAGNVSQQSVAPPLHPTRRRWPIVAASLAASVLVAAALFVLLPSSISLADVTKAIQSQKWIRGTSTMPDGKRSAIWLSPERQLWASAFTQGSFSSFRLIDGQEHVEFEYRSGDKMITKFPADDEQVRKYLSFDGLSTGNGTLGPWLFGEKIVQQERRNVSEAGKTWIEFELTLWRGGKGATLRVDPETRLPVYLLVATSEENKLNKTEFDYPAEGPSDIYSLGVARNIKIDDRVPSEGPLSVLRAMAASRARIGDFRLFVGQSPILPSSVVYRKGNKWRVDSWRPQVAIDSLPEAAKGQDWNKWFEEQLHLSQQRPLFVCDGKTVWENSNFQPAGAPRWKVSKHTGPQDLMSGEGRGMLSKAPGAKIASLLFPDLSPKRGWFFEFDSKPADAPGCVLLKRSARITFPPGAVGHEWYYVDPAKGHAVVRAELFNLPADTPGNPKVSKTRQTIRMEDFQQTTSGFWYPRVVYDSMPTMNQQGQSETTVRYHFDFKGDLPDSLFTVDDVPKQER